MLIKLAHQVRDVRCRKPITAAYGRRPKYINVASQVLAGP